VGFFFSNSLWEIEIQPICYNLVWTSAIPKISCQLCQLLQAGDGAELTISQVLNALT
jgi:hypothetical protein